MEDQAKHPVATSRKTIRLLDALRSLGGAGVTELAEELDMNKSTVHNHLSTLEAEELVVREGPEYELGLRLLELGGYVQSQNPLYRIAGQELENLASKSGELATLSVEENGRSVCLAIERGDQAVDLEVYPGYRRPMHLTAHGKAILAHLPSERIDEIIERHGLSAATPKSITDPDGLRSQLETVRDQGYAIDEGEYIKGLQCVAVPIQDGEGEVIGAIGISAPATRTGSDDILNDLPELVQSSANVIRININHQ